MSTLKISVLAAWAFSLFCMLFFAGSTLGTMGKVLFWFLVVAHALECIVFYPRLKHAEGGLGANLFQVFVFGVTHMRELDEQVEDSGH